MKNIIYLFIFGFLLSCSKTEVSPEELATKVLKTYVDEFFKVKKIEDLEKLSNLTSSTLKEKLSKIDQAMFDEMFVKSDIQVVSFKIRDRRQVGENRFSFIYEIQLISNRGGRHTEVNKKIAFVTQDPSNNWTLAEVRNINSTINYSNEISIVP